MVMISPQIALINFSTICGIYLKECKVTVAFEITPAHPRKVTVGGKKVT
jgi:hypothetical protein